MKKLVLTILIFIQSVVVFAQTSGVRGKVIDSKTQKPLSNVITSIANTNLMQVTDRDGKFVFKDVVVGNQILQIKSQGYKDQLLKIEIEKGKIIDIGVAVLDEDITEEQQLSLVTITDSDLGDDNSGSENTAGLLQATRDVFQQAAAFSWGQARFRIRGLDSDNAMTMINGVAMNKIYDGRPQWSNWGGLNDATRNQEFTMGSAPSDYTFGGILGTTEINTRASIYRPGSRISFSGTNTNYSWRTMATHASGMNTNGWAYVVSGSRRWAQEGYFEGTDYNAYSVFASVEKKFNDRHSLNFTSIYAQNSRGKNSPNSDEVSSIAGVNYNSYWGFQDGKKRNSRDKDVEEPINMLSHYWKIGKQTNLNTNIMYQTGSVGNSRIDFSGVNNPDPTYYRNLPSYYNSLYNNDLDFVNANDPSVLLPGGLGGIYTPDFVGAASASFLTNRQINWNDMYKANSNPIIVDGLESGRSPAESRYILYEDRTDDKQFTANSVINSRLADNIVLNAGATFRNLKSHNFQNVLDLLGGLYFSDVDAFGVGNQRYSDLNNPDRKVVVGDTYGYNFNLLANNIDAFTQFKFDYKKFDFYLAQNYTRAEYQREGLYRNGYYATNSFGKSKKEEFEGFGFKGGFTYKISGRHFININGFHSSRIPTLRNVFPNSRISNNAISDIENENISSIDGSYIIKTPKLKARITGYFSKISKATETSFFFAEGVFDDGGDGSGDTDAFVAETITNISKKNIGAELGIEYQVTSTIKATLSAAYGEYTYDNNPNVSINRDAIASETNPNPVVDFGTSKLKGYRLPGSPQQAYSVGLEYRDPKFWWVGANANYLADNYLDIAPLLRTDNFFQNSADINGFSFPEATLERGRKLLKQEKFDDFTLVNLTGGKSWRIKGKTFGVFASINNVLDVIYKTGGFEQARNANYRELNQDVSSGTPAFAPKYFYGYGRTYFVNLYINF